MALVLGIPASHGPDNKNSAARTRQIVGRPDTPTGTSTTVFA
jgi:hypothetical protein